MTIKLYDNTRLSASRDCLRYFYFRHVLHWVSDGAALPLVFGASWHAAMEVVWALLCTEDPPAKQVIVEAGHQAFMDRWVKEGMDPELSYEEEKDWSPRTPARAYEMLAGYISERHEHSHDMELLAIERPFVVPLDTEQNMFYVGKIDKIVLKLSRIIGIEHKTTTAYRKEGGFRGNFVDSFSPNSQVDGYLYALHMMYPGKVGGIWVDAALVHKQAEAFMYIPIEKQMEHLDAWLWETKHWISRIEEEKERLKTVKPEDRYMTAFPKNTNSCWNYNHACMFLDCCKAWPNPLGRERPANIIEEPWDPLKDIPGVAQILENMMKKGS